jgi:signal transduction histidine kinase
MSPRVWNRIAAPVGVVSVLLLVTAVGAAWYIHDLQASAALILADHVAGVRAAQELELGVRDLKNQAVRYLVSRDPRQLEPIPRLRERVMSALDRAEGTAFDAAERDLMARIRAGLRTFFAEYDTVTRDGPPGADSFRTLEQLDEHMLHDVIDPTREFVRLNEGMLARANEENRAVAARMTAGLVGLGLCGSVGGLLGGWVIAASVRRHMLFTETRLRSTARELGKAAGGAVGATGSALEDVTKGATAVLDRLRQTERAALRAEQLARVGQMAAGIAHEVRNPLTAIKLVVQALADGRTETRLRPREARVLDEEIGRLEAIISSFLDFARPPRPEVRPAEIGELARQVADRLRGRAELHGVAIAVDAPAPVVAEADPNQVQQVLYNLIFNALDAQPGGGRVRVGVRAEGPAVVIAVEDEGHGLPADLRDTMFDPFVSSKESGLGLGLSICRRIVDGHGGSITAADRPGGGAAFVVRLPLRHAADPTPVSGGPDGSAGAPAGGTASHG